MLEERTEDKRRRRFSHSCLRNDFFGLQKSSGDLHDLVGAAAGGVVPV